MKKILLSLLTIFLLVGCTSNLNNTPTKKVEQYLDKYQKLDDSVVADLNATLDTDTSITEDTKEDYLNLFKDQYKNLKYEIKDETIDGDIATVETEITVIDYASVISETEAYRTSDENKFKDENGNYDEKEYSKYRLEKLKAAKEETTYTLYLTVSKQDDKWVLNQLSNEDLSKINGLYNE